MKYFRTNIYLSFFDLFSSFFQFMNPNDQVTTLLRKHTNKDYNIITSQCRVSFYIVLKYLENKFPHKNEIIIQSYNLSEMVNVAQILDYKIIYIDLDEHSYVMPIDQIIQNINENTAAVLITNMFNNIDYSLKLKELCNTNNVNFII